MNTKKLRRKLSLLLAKENGESIAVLYKDVKVPYKSRYISYNNIKKLMVYSILIIDHEKWIEKLSNISSTSVELFEYYGFDVSNNNRWKIG